MPLPPSTSSEFKCAGGVAELWPGNGTWLTQCGWRVMQASADPTAPAIADRAQGHGVWALLHRLPLHPELAVRAAQLGQQARGAAHPWLCQEVRAFPTAADARAPYAHPCPTTTCASGVSLFLLCMRRRHTHTHIHTHTQACSLAHTHTQDSSRVQRQGRGGCAAQAAL